MSGHKTCGYVNVLACRSSTQKLMASLMEKVAAILLKCLRQEKFETISRAKNATGLK